MNKTFLMHKRLRLSLYTNRNGGRGRAGPLSAAPSPDPKALRITYTPPRPPGRLATAQEHAEDDEPFPTGSEFAASRGFQGLNRILGLGFNDRSQRNDSFVKF